MSSAPPIKATRPRPVVLCVLDGWGRPTGLPDDAITAGRTPTFDHMISNCAHAVVHASGAEVGLPEGQMGNSEVGHMNLGSGRIVKQDLPRIDEAVQKGELGRAPALQQMITTLKKNGGACHLMGLMSPGGIHSHQTHMLALAHEISTLGIEVWVHAFLDGRDTPPQSAAGFMASFEAELEKAEYASVATVCGRYYAMDRDKRWERVKQAYDAITQGQGASGASAKAAIEAAYQDNITDEFVEPAIIAGYSGLQDGDGILMANFRADRAREILTALLDPDFDGFVRQPPISISCAVGMVEYSAALAPLMTALFLPEKVDNNLGEVIAMAGLKQLRIAETEKYAHVTFFFNGGGETAFTGEDRILVPSPKVATYDLKPEMAATEVTERLIEAIRENSYDFIVVNFANPDMVGHTGNFIAAIQAVETVDTCLHELRKAIEQAEGVLLITADHGNIEHMKDLENDQPYTAHTTNVVPVILAVAPGRSSGLSIKDGRLADIAPTLLRFLGLPQPKEMTGEDLIVPVAGKLNVASSVSQARTG